MLNFEVDYTSAKRIQDALNGLGEALGDVGRNRILRLIGRMYLHETERRFETQSDPDRKKWAELRPTTVNFKSGLRRHPSGRGPSIGSPTRKGLWTGTLASSLQMVVRGDTVLIGSNEPHAPWFHYGVRAGKTWGYQPSRRFLGRNTRIDQKALEMLKKILIDNYGISEKDVKNSNYGL